MNQYTKSFKLLCIIIFAVSIQTLLHAQTNILLYEAGKVPNSKPTKILGDTLSFKLNGKDTTVIIPRTIIPSVTVYTPPKGKVNGTAVIVCSGGAYYAVADPVEGIPAAKKLSEAGFTVFLLHYRVPRADMMIDKEVAPLQDAQRAIQYVREHANDYGIDVNRIGIMGFSAGGHLVSTAGTHFGKSYIDNPKLTSLRPDFMVLVYPVISFTDSITHLVSRNQLIGPDITPEKIKEYSNELQVTPQTPPTFIVHSIDDETVKVNNALLFIAACQQNHVPIELFLYEKGVHGYGVFNPLSKVQWIDACIDWINTNKSSGKNKNQQVKKYQ